MFKKTMALCMALLLAIAAAGCAAPAENQDAQNPQAVAETAQPTAEPTQVPAEDATIFTAGTYTGKGIGAYGDIVLDVTFDDNHVTDIVITQSKETKPLGGAALESMRLDVLEYQTIALDTVSGATGSSMGFKMAMRDALTQAGATEADFSNPIPSLEYQDVTTDVVVVGGGIAGLCAANEAHEQGLNVILVEQLGVLGGSSFTASFLVGADTQAQKAAGITDTYEQVVTRFNYKDKLLDPGLYNAKSVAYMIDESGKTIDWLIGMGAECYNVTRQDDIHHFGSGDSYVIGWTVIPTLHDTMDKNNIDYRLNTKAVEILMEGDVAVGVKVETKDGQTYNINAKGVVICTGGYFNNKEMVAKYKPEFNGFTRTTGGKGADGSGMLLAQAAGAELSYMDQGSALPYMLIERNGIPSVAPAGIIRSRGGILVGLEGKRIVNENAPYLHSSIAVTNAKDGRGFVIFNQEGCDMVAVDSAFQKMLDEGYVVAADTVAELAQKVGIDAENLENTVAHYGEMVRNGEDTDFGRKDTFMRTDFAAGPYYCIEITPCMHTTFGGITIDSKTHVLRPDGSIIKGLYAAGECTPSHLQGVATNTFSAVFGRLSARTIKSDIAGN